MSGPVLGSIEIQMLADLARLRQDMDGAKGIVGKATADMSKMAAGLKSALGALGLGLSAAAFAGWIKGAIDAADESFNLSKKIGIASKDLAGIQLAFKQAGVDGTAMQTAMVKLAKGVSDGNEAFGRMGVSVRNADGSLKGSKQVLYDVADVFASMPDGINKTALATQVFGKAGADLLPMLGEGSDGLREMADMAEKLGLVIDDKTAEAADSFNDTLELVGMAGQGVARSIASQLLPTLNALAGTMLQNVISSDAVAKSAEILGTGLKLLFSTALYGAEIFNSLGKTAGAVAAVLVAVAQGEFAQAREIWRAADADIQASNKQTQKAVEDLWTGAAGQATTQAKALTTAVGGTSIATKEQADAAKKAADEQAKLTKAGQDYLRQLEAQHAEATRGLALGRDTTDVEKQLLKLSQDLAVGKIKLTEAERAAAEAKIVETGAMRDQVTLTRELLKLQVEAQNARLTESASIAEQTAKQLEQNLTFGKTAAELRALEIARIGNNLATAEQALQTALLRQVSADELEGYTLTVEELRKLKKAKEEGNLAELGAEGAAAAKVAAAEWAKTADQIGQGLTDSLFRAFEAGKGFFETLWSGIKNLFKTTVLQLAIKPVQNAITGAVGSLLGVPAAAATGGAGGGLGGLGGLGSLGSLFTDFGGSVAFGADSIGSWLMSNTSGGLNSMGGSLMQNAGSIGDMAGIAGDALGYLSAFNDLTKGNYGAAAGAAIGTYFGGPVGAMIGKAIGGWADKVFAGGAGTPHTGSVVGITGTGANTMYGDASSILNNYNAGTDQALRGAGGVAVGALNALAGAFGGAQNFSAVLKFASDGQDASIGDLLLNRGNTSLTNWSATQGDFKKYSADGKAGFESYLQDVAAATRDAMTAVGLPQWAKDTFGALASNATLADIAGTAEAVAQTQRALQGLQLGVSPLGGVFAQVAGLSSDALFELTKFAGGIEAFAGKIKGYVGSFYSEQEQAALSAASIQKLLTDAGINTTGLDSKADFRSLVDSTDVSTEAGRRQLAALLDAAQGFAAISDVLAASGGSLADLAASAPRDAVLGGLLTDQTSAGTAAPSSSSLLTTANSYLTSIADSSAAALNHLAALVSVQSAAATQTLQLQQSLIGAIAGGYRGDLLADLANDGSNFNG